MTFYISFSAYIKYKNILYKIFIKMREYKEKEKESKTKSSLRLKSKTPL